MRNYDFDLISDLADYIMQEMKGKKYLKSSLDGTIEEVELIEEDFIGDFDTIPTQQEVFQSFMDRETSAYDMFGY